MLELLFLISSNNTEASPTAKAEGADANHFSLGPPRGMPLGPAGEPSGWSKSCISYL
jgi:hypothetical protein